MPSINVYLTFDGNCEEAFDFYRSVFGRDFDSMSRFSEMPDSPEFQVPDEEKNRIMHVSLPISKETILMGSDTAGGYGPPMVVGNNFSLSVNTDNKKEADDIFNKLADGGHITMPMADTFWESYFGMLIDKFGIKWMVSFGTSGTSS